MNRKILIGLSLKYGGNYNRIIQDLDDDIDIASLDYVDNAITILDDIYPDELLDLKYPPLVLYYKGNLNLLNEEKISIVGSRRACDYALSATKLLVEKNIDKVIVSGLALGIDALAHQEAKKTIGILGSGINYIYPYQNKYLFKKLEKEGLILSEYPEFIKPYAHHFPFRNRIIAALSDTLYVMQSSKKSGTMTTINEALELNKDIKVLPYDIFNKYGSHNNTLINEGALLIEEEELF